MKRCLKHLWIFLVLPATVLAAPIITDPKGEPATTAKAVEDFIANVQGIVAATVGAIAMAMIIWGAVIMGTAGGNEDKISKGKKILTFAIGGLILILFAQGLIYAFVQLLGGSIGTSMVPTALAANSVVPNTEAQTIEGLISNVITFVLPIIAAILVLMMVYSGSLYITSGGDPDKTAKAKKTLLWTIVATILIVMSYSIVVAINNIVLNNIKP